MTDYNPDQNLELKKAAAESAKSKFYAARKEIALIIDGHAELFEELRSRIVKYNKALDEYKVTLRDVVKANGNKGFTTGEQKEFKVIGKTKTILDEKPLLAAIPEAQLLEAQAIKKEVVYTVREDEVKTLLVRGYLTQEVVDAAIKKIPDTPHVVCPQYKPLNI